MVEPPVISASTLDAGFLIGIPDVCTVRLPNTLGLSGFKFSFAGSTSFAVEPWINSEMCHKLQDSTEPN